MKKEFLSFEIKDLQLKSEDAETGEMTFGGYASAFGNVDHTNDIVLKGAFTKSLAKRMPKLCWQHYTNDVIGVVTKAYEDDYGLFVECKISPTEKGKDAYILLKDGAINQMSIGYSTVDCEYQNNIRMLKEVELYEVSLVTFPANEAAKITKIKSADFETIKDFEKLLKARGFSQKQAKIIASNSFALLQRDVVDDSENIQRDAELKQNEEIKNELQNLLNIIKG